LSLQYWRTYNPENEFDTPLNFSASGQFSSLRPNDILWVVALKQHRLTLLGKLIVGKVAHRVFASEADRIVPRGVANRL
jgi:hypothetical protein